MSAEITHPSSDRLRAYSLNQLEPADRALVQNHLRFCSPCRQKVRRLEKEADAVLDTSHGQPDDTSVTTKPLLDLTGTEPSLELFPPELAEHPRFTLLALLGTGGMGAVYRALDRLTAQVVAIKILKSFDTESFQRFKREIDLLNSLSHPNLVPIFEASQAGGTPFIVMECVEGISLDRLLLRRGILHINDACEIARQVAIALAHAHEEKVVHRDVKPPNIMITPQGQVKLLDWGLARVLEESANYQDLRLTLTNQAVGTLEYIAPEQWQDSSTVDHRADLYSLGGTLYTLLTGLPPVTSKNLALPVPLVGWTDDLHKMLTSVRRDVKGQLRRLLARLLDADPDRRPPSADQVAAWLEPYCVGADLARLVNESQPYPPVRPPRRASRAVLAVLTLLLCIGIILAWLAW
jgi:serine/threonine-protein kinase